MFKTRATVQPRTSELLHVFCKKVMLKYREKNSSEGEAILAIAIVA